MVADSQRIPIWKADTLFGNSEQLAFDVAPLSDGAAKLVLEGDYFFAGVHASLLGLTIIQSLRIHRGIGK